MTKVKLVDKGNKVFYSRLFYTTEEALTWADRMSKLYKCDTILTKQKKG